MPADYFVGLDLGQTTDYTALAVLEHSDSQPPLYAIRHLQLYILGTSYPAMIAAVVQLVAQIPAGRCRALVVDQTGVGRAVVDLLRTAGLKTRLIPVTITAGQAVTQTEDHS